MVFSAKIKYYEFTIYLIYNNTKYISFTVLNMFILVFLYKKSSSIYNYLNYFKTCPISNSLFKDE